MRAISSAVLPTLDPGYDVAFFDGGTPVPALHKTLRGLLRTGGTLITANLNHGGTADAVRKALFDGKAWRSALIDEDGETAISVKLCSIIGSRGAVIRISAGRKSMTVQAILLPLFVEVILTFLLLFWLAPLRARDFKAGVARPDNIALARAELVAAYACNRLCLLQPVRTAGAVLCADHPRLCHASRRLSSSCWPGSSCCFVCLQAFVHVPPAISSRPRRDSVCRRRTGAFRQLGDVYRRSTDLAAARS